MRAKKRSILCHEFQFDVVHMNKLSHSSNSQSQSQEVQCDANTPLLEPVEGKSSMNVHFVFTIRSHEPLLHIDLVFMQRLSHTDVLLEEFTLSRENNHVYLALQRTSRNTFSSATVVMIQLCLTHCGFFFLFAQNCQYSKLYFVLTCADLFKSFII